MSSKPHILLVTARTPWPTASGGQQRTFLLCEAIRRVANLHTLLVDPKPKPDPADITVMRDRFGLVDDGLISTDTPSRWRRLLNPGRAELGRSEALSESITAVADRLGCKTIVFRYLPLAARAASRRPDGIRRLVDIDDMPSLRTRTEADLESGLRRIAKLWISHSITAWQRRAISRSDGGWVSCQADLDIIRNDNFNILPNIPLDAFDTPLDPTRCRQRQSSRSVLFVGAMGYEINRQATDWFLDNVWPIVLGLQPDAEFRIAGSRLDDERKQKIFDDHGSETAGFRGGPGTGL